MAYLEEVEVISSVCKNKDIHVMFDNNADELITDCADIWGFIKDYYDQTRQVPDSDLIVTRFKDFDPVNSGPTVYHIDKLRQAYLDESIRNTLRRVAQLVNNNESAVALKELSKDVTKMSRIGAKVRDIDVTDIENALNYFEQTRQSAENGNIGIKTDITSFDVCLPMGISKGQLGILLAYPAIGKSWLALYFAVQAWKHGYKPMLISLEMTEYEVRNRIFTIIGDGFFSHRALSAGRVEDDEFKLWAAKNLEGRPPFKIISNDTGSEMTPNLINSKIDQYKPDIVIVDYLQLMTDNSGTSQNETVKIKNLSRELKLLAIAQQIPVIAIASATPDDSTDLESVPQLGQVAWSRQIAYDADWVLSMGRRANSDVLEAAFRKNRHGFMGDFFMQIDFDRGIFKEILDVSEG
jgi:replicative DNA helicase